MGNLGQPISDMLRVILVDDDPLARRGLRRLLADQADVSIVGEYSNARLASDAVQRLAPDAVLLDIEMPGQSGFEFASMLPTGGKPYVVFVTAHDRYALEAFSRRAVDYVLKPVSRARLSEAVGRAREQRDNARLATWAEQWKRRDGAAPPRDPYLSELLVRRGFRSIILQVSDLHWIEADSYYARLHVGGRDYLLREPLQRLEQRLDPRIFVRVHRSAIVNITRVLEVHRHAPHEHVLLMTGGERVRVSRSRWKWLSRQLRERTQVAPSRPLRA